MTSSLTLLTFGQYFQKKLFVYKEFCDDVWGKLLQRFADRAIGQWRRRLECVVQQQGGHIEL